MLALSSVFASGFSHTCSSSIISGHADTAPIMTCYVNDPPLLRRMLQAADDIITGVRLGSSLSSGKRESRVMASLPAAATLAVQSSLHSAPHRHMNGSAIPGGTPR